MSWPAVEGTYVVGDPAAPVAICVLTSSELIGPLAAVPGVAIAGDMQTANLGLESIVVNGGHPGDQVPAALRQGIAPIAPSGRREPLRYDPKGYFVIGLDRRRTRSLCATTGRTTRRPTKCVAAPAPRSCWA